MSHLVFKKIKVDGYENCVNIDYISEQAGSELCQAQHQLQILGYRRSCGVNSKKSEILRILRGPGGRGSPKKMSNLYFAKNCVTPLK